MARIVPILFPAQARQLEALGERLRLARLRRRYSAAAVATRAGVTRTTLHRAERGDPGVSLGTYGAVLRVLGLHGDLDTVARDDELGRKLQDLNLPARRTAPRRAQPRPPS
ncbi:helix-turn-helix transcriptional regulator [Opitutus sp. ER46]|uniref:helix-turn-helix domain-containing protein n=1 Tax=Opitutus sp. ER46 TaxID=2161864 RepID=UPI000D320B86|nr:transcriptional regulator [Opitutus sp. ER46]